MSEKLMQALAAMAESRPLRALYILCDSQKQVSTGKLREYLDCAGDTLAGYAATLRHEFDMLTAPAPAAPVVQEEQQPIVVIAYANPSDLNAAIKHGKPFFNVSHEQRPCFTEPLVLLSDVLAAPPAQPDAALVEAMQLLEVLRGRIGGALWSLDSEDRELAERTDRAIATLAGKGGE